MCCAVECSVACCALCYSAIATLTLVNEACRCCYALYSAAVVSVGMGSYAQMGSINSVHT